MSETLTWAEPAERATRGASSAVADMLRTRPGDWAIVEEHPVPSDSEDRKKLRQKVAVRSAGIKSGRIASYAPKGAFDSVTRSETNDAGDPALRCYARYLGPEAERRAVLAAQNEPARVPKVRAPKPQVVDDGVSDGVPSLTADDADELASL